MTYCHFLSWMLQKSTPKFKIQSLSVCFRLKLQHLTSTSTSTLTSNVKLKLQTSNLKLPISYFNFTLQLQTKMHSQLHIITWKVSFKYQLKMSVSNFKAKLQQDWVALMSQPYWVEVDWSWSKLKRLIWLRSFLGFTHLNWYISFLSFFFCFLTFWFILFWGSIWAFLGSIGLSLRWDQKHFWGFTAIGR